MNTKKVCEKLKISYKALRVYEKLNIVIPQRDKNDYRNYSDDDLLKLRQIIILKNVGLELKNIKRILDKGTYESDKIIHTLYLQLKVIEAKRIQLRKMENVLKEGINEALNKNIEYGNFFDKIDNSIKESTKNVSTWIDKWGFDTWAKSYDDCVKKDGADTLGLFSKYDFILESIVRKIGDRRKVIDIGCGTANIVKKLNQNVQYTGIDQSIEMLILAKEKNKNIKLRLGNFLDKPFIENEFDVVISSFALHHLKPDEKKVAVRNLLRYIKNNGKIVIADLMFLNKEERERKKKWFISNKREKEWGVIEDEYYTDIEEMKNYVESLEKKLIYQHVVNYTFIIEIS
ncbi:MerR family transcriptional regulator [Clostridium felsineum]|uniref:MerR family transcriptional regulator n=1 Tax=Clostridium felsineum TaxID=36839 RepID=UPI00098CD73B|nr:MerR family transcriptional regulator [Clostridium felsineum]URZ04449.1 2-methoxy-6-polyprenyl-1,4-benzoquinol methylase, mitochondrial [Clostridium felsineum]URZ17034.1 2-methoxy-6-polyprenyl-1,4-benzoquinol methylase, mitochondrial [Clostridium felsineum DSM 794]